MFGADVFSADLDALGGPEQGNTAEQERLERRIASSYRDLQVGFRFRLGFPKNTETLNNKIQAGEENCFLLQGSAGGSESGLF